MRTKLVWYFESVPVDEIELELGDARRTFCPPGEGPLHPSTIRLWRERGVPWITTDGVDQPLSDGVTVLTEWRPELQRIETPREAWLGAIWAELRWPIAGIPITAALALLVGIAIPAAGVVEPKAELTSHVVEMSPEEYKRLTEALRKRPVIVPAKHENVAKTGAQPKRADKVARPDQTRKPDPVPARAPKRVASLGGEAAPLQTKARTQPTAVDRNAAAAPTQLTGGVMAGLETTDRGGLGVAAGGERGERGGSGGSGRAGFGGGGGNGSGVKGGFQPQRARQPEAGSVEREAMAKVCSVGTRSTMASQIDVGGTRYSATSVHQWCRTALPQGLTWTRLLAALGHTA